MEMKNETVPQGCAEAVPRYHVAVDCVCLTATRQLTKTYTSSVVMLA